MKVVKNITFYIAIGLILNGLEIYLEGSFLNTYLDKSLITILLTLLAINITTSSLIIAKLQELSAKTQQSFKETYKQLKLSLVEQLVVIAVSGVLLMLKSSKIISSQLEYHQLIFNSLLTTAFIYAISNLKDTAMAIFDVINANDRP